MACRIRVNPVRMDRSGATTLADVLVNNARLKSVRLSYNPGIDDESKGALRAVAEQREDLTLEL